MSNFFHKFINIHLLSFIFYCKYNYVFFFSNLFFSNQTNFSINRLSNFRRLTTSFLLFSTRIKARVLYYANNWIYTTNHKRIAVNYFWFVILSGIFGMVLATVIRLELAYPGVGIFAGDSLQYLSLATAHGVIMVFFMIIPLLSGAFANFLLPTQLGVHDVAFPRLNSAAFWFLPGGLIMLGQLICLDRRYQRMNCFNIREVQSLLKRRFFTDLITNNEHHLLLDQTMLGLRFKTNNLNTISSHINLHNNLGLASSLNNRSINFTENNFNILSFNKNNLFMSIVDFFYNKFTKNYIIYYKFTDLIGVFFIHDLKFLHFNFTIFSVLLTVISNILKKIFYFPVWALNIIFNLLSLIISYKTYLSLIISSLIKDTISFFNFIYKIISFISIYLKNLNNRFNLFFHFYSDFLSTNFSYNPFFNFLFSLKSFVFLNNIDSFKVLFSFFVSLFSQIYKFCLLKLKLYITTLSSYFTPIRLNEIFVEDYAAFNNMMSKFINYLSLRFLNTKKQDLLNVYFNTSIINYYNVYSYFDLLNAYFIFLTNSSTWRLFINKYLNSRWFIETDFYSTLVSSIFWFDFFFNSFDNLSIKNIDWKHYYNKFVDFYSIWNFYFFSNFTTIFMFHNFIYEHYCILLELNWKENFINFFGFSVKSLFWGSNSGLFKQSNLHQASPQLLKEWTEVISLLFYYTCFAFSYLFSYISFHLPYLLGVLNKFYLFILQSNPYSKNYSELNSDSNFFFFNKSLNDNLTTNYKHSNEESISQHRNLKFHQPVFKYDYKVGDYFPKYNQETYSHLLTTLGNITSGIRPSSWFFSEISSESLLLNFSKFYDSSINWNWGGNFNSYVSSENRVLNSFSFYNFFLLANTNNNFINLRWNALDLLNQKFARMYTTSSMQQRIYSNWRQLKFTREAWRCKLLTARHQKNLFKKYVHENGVFWSIEKNARDLLPGWAMITPFASRTRFTAIGKVDIGVSAIILVLISSIISGVNFLVTYRYLSTLNNRKMRDARSFFTEGIMCSSWMMIAANPMLIIGLIMLLCDRHWQTSFFDYSGGGDTILFQHMFWFFGHPEVYIVIIPTFGFVNTLFSYYLRKRISARASLLYSIYTIAFLGFFVWGHHMYMVGLSHTTRMLFSTLTVMISVPAATKLMHWCVTLVNSSFNLELPFLFMITYVFLFVSGGISGMCVAHTGMDVLFHDTFYVIGHFHVMFAGAAMFGSFGAFYFYFSAIFGVKYSRIYAYLHFTYYLLGQLLTVIPMFWLGYAGMPRRVLDYPAAFGGWHSVITAGHMLSVAGLIAFFFMIFDSLRQSKAATRNNFGIMRYNTRLNFYFYEIARIMFTQRKGFYLYRYYRPTSLKLDGYNFNNYEHLETTLFSYVFIKEKNTTKKY